MREVVRLGRARWSGTPAQRGDEEVVEAAMAATEFSRFAERPFAALSGGERARAALARVLAQRAPLLLLDESTAALDLRHQELVLRLCRERAAAGDVVVVVLPDLGPAAAHGDAATVFDAALLSEVYRQRVEVVPHPRTGERLVVPVRRPDPCG